MSAKRISTIVVVALFLLAALATTANARPDPAAPGGTATKAAAASHLASGHHAATGASAPAPVVAKPLQNGSDGISTPAIAGLMGLALLAGAMIAIWAAARTGYISHERTASR